MANQLMEQLARKIGEKAVNLKWETNPQANVFSTKAGDTVISIRVDQNDIFQFGLMTEKQGRVEWPIDAASGSELYEKAKFLAVGADGLVTQISKELFGEDQNKEG